MERVDGRKASLAVKEERRRIVIRMRKEGYSVADVSVATGLAGPTISVIWSSYKRDGESILAGKRIGHVVGEGRSLTPEQEAIIRRKIIDKCPDQLKLDFALWTRGAVKQLILQELQIDMPVRTVGSYLHRWGFTPQKPAKVAFERRPEAVKKWLDEEYPAIKVLAEKEDAEIYWGDETGLRSSDVRGRGFAPIGKTPVVKATANYENLSMVSAITNKGKVSWMIVDGAVNAARFIEFLDRIIQDAKRKVLLILDNLRVHHSKLVKEWLEGKKDRIELFYLPSYSPDLNPDEHLNADLKYGVGSRSPVRTKKALGENAKAHMEILEASPERIQSYFSDPAIQYAS
jgi:transposase